MKPDSDALLNQSRESSLRARRDSMLLVQQSLEADPENSLAHATRGVMRQRWCFILSSSCLKTRLTSRLSNFVSRSCSGWERCDGQHRCRLRLRSTGVVINPITVITFLYVRLISKKQDVMYMQGRSQDGARWLDELHQGGHWQGLGQLVLHLWWHRALFHLLRDEHDVRVFKC